jgi:hypothetical protein
MMSRHILYIKGMIMRHSLIVTGVCALVGLSGTGAFANCVYDSKGTNETSCAPGNEIIKNGPGNWTVYLKDAGYTVTIEGPGDVCLKGISDYSKVTGIKNGDGKLYWNPMDASKGAPPDVKVLGPGGVIRSNC